MAGAAMLLPPVVDDVPERFSAALPWRFRLASLGLQAVMRSAIGLAFGAPAHRLLGPVDRRATRTPAGGAHRRTVDVGCFRMGRGPLAPVNAGARRARDP